LEDGVECGGNEIYTAWTEDIKSRSRKGAKAKDKEMRK
jgi:hypothetical protein